MEVVITANYDEMSEKAADTVAKILSAEPDAVLGLATGSTPMGMYRVLVDKFRRGEISFAKVKSVNLDEYLGLAADHPQSYAFFMDENLFSKVDIDKNNTFLPCGTAADSEEECRRYNALLSDLVPDIQILGIGSNGHIGFNEPGTPFDSVTHVVELTKSTIKDNSRLFSSIGEVPEKAYSMGIKNILAAKKIVVMASGRQKARAVRDMLNAEISPACPATALRLHPDVTLIADEEAASLLRKN